MKLLKKVAALAALAAVCITMAAPVSAEAAAPKPCMLHSYEVFDSYIQTDTSEHDYVIAYVDYNGDGRIDGILTKKCTITIVAEVYDLACVDCGFIYRSASSKLVSIEHSDNCGVN